MEGGLRHDPAATSVEAYRRGLEAINREAGPDKFILACGAPLLPSVGLVDGMRIGPDVGGRWLLDPGWPDWPVGNCSIRAAAIPSLWSQWMHGHLWQNDPECIMVRDTPTRYEREALGRFERDLALVTPDYRVTPFGLTVEEAGLWARLVWMTGGMALLSEVWGELPADRRDLLARCFPAHGRKISVLDWYEEPGAAVLVAAGAPFLAGIFNFGDLPCRPVIPAKKLGFSGCWSLRERWSGELLQGQGDSVVFPEIPPHAGRIWEIAS
jgi:alpha-galactosidase